MQTHSLTQGARSQLTIENRFFNKLSATLLQPMQKEISVVAVSIDEYCYFENTNEAHPDFAGKVNSASDKKIANKILAFCFHPNQNDSGRSFKRKIKDNAGQLYTEFKQHQFLSPVPFGWKLKKSDEAASVFYSFDDKKQYGLLTEVGNDQKTWLMFRVKSDQINLAAKHLEKLGIISAGHVTVTLPSLDSGLPLETPTEFKNILYSYINMVDDIDDIGSIMKNFHDSYKKS